MMHLRIVLCFLVFNARAGYSACNLRSPHITLRPPVYTLRPPTRRSACPCQSYFGQDRYDKAQFAFVGKVVTLNFVPVVPPTGYSSIIVQKVKNCKGIGTPTVRINTLRSNTACPGSGGAFDNLISGREYLFFGTYKRLAPDNRLSFVVDPRVIYVATTSEHVLIHSAMLSVQTINDSILSLLN